MVKHYFLVVSLSGEEEKFYYDSMSTYWNSVRLICEKYRTKLLLELVKVTDTSDDRKIQVDIPAFYILREGRLT